MSLSVNHPPLLKVDTSVLGRSSVSPSTTGGNSNAQASGTPINPAPVQNNYPRVLPNEVMNPSAALSQLFDMLEMVFKAMREMVSGMNLAPAALPESGKLPLKPDAREQRAKLDTGKLPVPPQPTDHPAVKPDAREQSAKLDTGKLPVPPQPADHPAVKPDAREQSAKLDTGKLPVMPQPTDHSVVNPDARRQHLMPIAPPLPEPDVTVVNDAKSNVHVNVNVSQCHCPGTSVFPDRGARPRVAPDVPDMPDMPGVVPRLDRHPPLDLNPDRAPSPKPEGKHDVKPSVTPKHEPEVSPAPKSEITPAPQPEVKPRPAPFFVPHLPPKPVPDMPVPDLTSPGPAETRFDSKNWRLKTRPSFNF